MENANGPSKGERPSEDVSNKEDTREASKNEAIPYSNQGKKSSWPKRTGDKLGLNPGILMLMTKLVDSANSNT